MKNGFVKWFMKYKVAVIGALAGVLAIGLGVSIYKYNADMKELQLINQQQTEQLNAQIAANNRTGYIATAEIKQGDILQDGVNVSISTFSSSADQSTFATADCIGKQAVVNIPAGTPISTNIVATTMPEQLNERECTFINLSANLLKGDFVDVRIMFPNGEDYIVVPKVAIQNPVIASNLVYLWLNEYDNELLSAAVVDANLHGAFIYTTKYIEPSIQEPNVTTYQPNAAVIDVMKKDKNVVMESEAALSITARESIEERLAAFEEAYPDFELKLNASDDIDEALKAIANNSATNSAGTQNSGTTTETDTANGTTGTDSAAAPGTTGTDSATTGTDSATTDTTITYGN